MKRAEQRLAEGFLFTDMYQLTMAQLYFQQGLHEKPAQFEHFFRNYPDYGTHRTGYCINAGLAWFLDWLEEAAIRDEDIAALRAQRGREGKPLFHEDFLEWLREHGRFDCLSIRAVPEGRVVHPNTPLTVVEGPLALAQIIETALLNQLNYQILIATKAARLRANCQGQMFLEFGVRRAHERSANAGTRAALIGGADFSSNVGVSHVLGYPPKGTHAHSMVQVFMALGLGELAAFRAYAKVYPDECLLLVDTINTLESGIPNAITVFEELRRQGYEPVGIRLDSGDLAYLSIQAAKALDAAGFEDCAIVLSSNLDELVIWQIVTQITQEAAGYGVNPERLIARLVYGVGTRLITSAGDAALGGVYKLVGVCDNGTWQPAIKISNTPEKTPNPGHKNLWRVYDKRGNATADVLSLAHEDLRQRPLNLRHYAEPGKFRNLPAKAIDSVEPLLVQVHKQGQLCYDLPDIEAIRQQRKADMARLDLGVKRLVNPHIYHVSLTPALWEMKQQLIAKVRNGLSNRQAPPPEEAG